MKNLIYLLLIIAMMIVGTVVQAQPPPTSTRIGLLVAVSPSAAAARAETFRVALRDLGYVEGKNIVIEARYAEGKLDRLPALAADLVRLKVGIIVTAGSQATRDAKKATSTIAIVMTNDPCTGQSQGAQGVSKTARENDRQKCFSICAIKLLCERSDQTQENY